MSIDFRKRYWDLLDLLEDSTARGIRLYDRDLSLFKTNESDSKATHHKNDPIENLYRKSIPFALHFKKVSCSWGYTLDEQDHNGGEFCIYHPIWSHKNITMPTLAFDNTDIHPTYSFILDQHPWMGDGVKVLCSLLADHHDQYALFLLDPNNKALRLNLTLESYLSWTLVTKGFYYWQYIFVDNCPKQEKKFLKDHYLDRMIKVLPILFPRDDYSNLLHHYQSFLDEACLQ